MSFSSGLAIECHQIHQPECCFEAEFDVLFLCCWDRALLQMHTVIVFLVFVWRVFFHGLFYSLLVACRFEMF